MLKKIRVSVYVCRRQAKNSVLQIEEDDESATDPVEERINFWQRLWRRQLLPVRQPDRERDACCS